MTNIDYRPPTADDIAFVADRMRAGDVLECSAVDPTMTPLTSLSNSVMASTSSFTVLVDGQPVAIFGFIYEGTLGAEIWLLGTDHLERLPREAVTEGRRILDGWADEFGLLHNFVDDRNTRAKRWLRAVGCDFGGTRPVGPDGVPFRYFWKLPSV